MGGDVGIDAVPQYYGVSIHAPAWGATTELEDVNYQLVVSIHAPAWGATKILTWC